MGLQHGYCFYSTKYPILCTAAVKVRVNDVHVHKGSLTVLLSMREKLSTV